MKISALIAGQLFGLALALAASALARGAEARPNLVFILADDSGLGEFGCYGGTAIPTPNIDGLAREHVSSPHYDAPELPGTKKGSGKRKAAK